MANEGAIERCTSGALPRLGEDTSEFLADHGLLFRHGSSLQLMSLVTECLNDSEEFAEVDPSADWQKWTERRPAFSLYYAALIDPAHDGNEGILCVLRAVLDGVEGPVLPHRPRLIIDYVTTRPAARGRGLASLLVNFVVEASSIFGANTYVLALEDSCVYWMGCSFALEPNEKLNARLNIFPDTHLLRRVGDPEDTGCEEDLQLARDAESEGDDDDNEEEEEEEEDGVDNDVELQAAMERSLADRRGDVSSQTQGGDDATVPGPAQDEEAELRAALAMSLAGEGTSTTVGPAEDEDADLQAALAMSLKPQ